jgi:gliding motility-associated-like protein
LSKANIQFLNLSAGGVAYLWDFGDNIGGSGEENPSYIYDEAGKYPVTLRAFNKYYECPADTTIILDIIPDGALFFANAFTPNGDGYNDVFYFVGEGIVEMEAQIFSRWGRQVAILNNPADGWNGLMDNTGASLPEGVYTFVMRATLNDGSKIERSGTITLIR